MILVPGSTYFSTLKQYVPGALERSISLQEAEVFIFSLLPTPHKLEFKKDPCLKISITQGTPFSTAGVLNKMET